MGSNFILNFSFLSYIFCKEKGFFVLNSKWVHVFVEVDSKEYFQSQEEKTYQKKPAILKTLCHET